MAVEITVDSPFSLYPSFLNYTGRARTSASFFLSSPLSHLPFSLQLMAAGAPGLLGRPAQLPVLEGFVSAHVFATALSPSMEGRTVLGM